MILRQLRTGLLDLLYPPRCLVCGEAPAGDTFCAGCEPFLRGDRAGRCPRCATTVGAFSLRGDACADCRRNPPAYAAALCLGSYRGPLRTAVLRLKQASGEGLAELLGSCWAAKHAAALNGLPLEAVVPVPLHWLRRLTRGYNQSAAIAHGLAGRLGLPVRPRWLRRTRATAPQKALGTTARQENVGGAFRAHAAVGGKHLLLVDDVMTTGATAAEAARVLLRAGAARVTVAILARVSPDEPGPPVI